LAFRLELNLSPTWDRVEDVRQAVQSGLCASYGDDQAAYALAMVAAELLENAIKYSRRESQVISISIMEAGGRLCISVTNCVDAGSPHVQTLARRLDWIRDRGDAEDAYSAAIAELYAIAAAEPGPLSGLGIARIAYEGGCHLALSHPRPGWITVTAEQRHQLAREAAAELAD
jgi:anti-sigma regulatory factor (Ser/Thr protein kinase)